MPAKIIYVLVWRSDWEKQEASGFFRTPSLDSEGFIHASDHGSVVWAANKFFERDRGEDLLLLAIDAHAAGAPVRYEDPGCGQKFPHIYGPLETKAVVVVRSMNLGNEGWELPE